MKNYFVALLLSSFCFFSLYGAEGEPAPKDANAKTAIAKETPSTNSKVIKVATRILPPFVFEQDGKLTGFSIDLWNKIAKGLNIKAEYDVKPTLKDLLEAVGTEKDQVGIAAISITASREQKFDFSYPMFMGGLSILVPLNKQASIFNSLLKIEWSVLIPAVIIYFVLILIPAHIIWFVEHNNEESGISKSYFKGVFDATFGMATMLAGQAAGYPPSYTSKIISWIWVYVSIFVTSSFIAYITASFTLESMQGDIKGPSDLKGKKVATVAYSTADKFLRKANAKVSTFDGVDNAINALEAGKVDAVVYDAPVLQYYALNDGKDKVQVVGETFRSENYGIVVKQGDELRKKINEQLLNLIESGVYKDLNNKWFGAKPTDQ